jgi:hypothetical protein
VAQCAGCPDLQIIPGLRSPSDQVNGLVYFRRMLDKIRLAEAGKLPECLSEIYCVALIVGASKMPPLCHTC